MTDSPSDKAADVLISKRPPKNGAVSVAFQDRVTQGGMLGGEIRISRATDESTVSNYVVYWASGQQTKIAGLPPIAKIPKANNPLSFSIADRIMKPVQATHLLVLTENTNGEMSTGVSILIEDKGVPENGAVSASFKDVHEKAGKLTGVIEIDKATNESDITKYGIYWGENIVTKLSDIDKPIAIVPKSGPLSFKLTAVDKPLLATHFLIHSRNKDGEMAKGIALPIVDLGVPEHTATSAAFKDLNPVGGKLSGEVQISKASNESDVTLYSLFWSKNGVKLAINSEPIATIGKGSVPLSIRLENVEKKADEVLILTSNNDGQMATGVSIPIVDLGVPQNAAASVAFEDNNREGGKLNGKIVVSKATNDADITEYVVYWGQLVDTNIVKVGANKIGSVMKKEIGDQSPLSLELSNVDKISDATHFLVYTRNNDGEMATGVATRIIDLGVPKNSAQSLAFVDTQPKGKLLSGEVKITKASDESDITAYALYWANNGTKLPTHPNPIATVGKGSDPLSVRLNDDALPAGANSFLLLTKNNDGEMSTGVWIPIVDLELNLILIQEASFGANCGAPRDNARRDIETQCNDKSSCRYSITRAALGDPAFGCAKDYFVRYICSASGDARTASAPAEADGRQIDLSCVNQAIVTPTPIPVTPTPIPNPIPNPKTAKERDNVILFFKSL